MKITNLGILNDCKPSMVMIMHEMWKLSEVPLFTLFFFCSLRMDESFTQIIDEMFRDYVGFSLCAGVGVTIMWVRYLDVVLHNRSTGPWREWGVIIAIYLWKRPPSYCGEVNEKS